MRILKTLAIGLITWEARAVLARNAPRIIAVTGSVGKTTTKDAVYAALSHSLHIRKSIKSHNTDIGVPLTILGLDNPGQSFFRWLVVLVRGAISILHAKKYPEWLVVEVGADRPGDIKRIASWLKPDFVVLTGVPDMPAHIEYFKTWEDLLEEKLSLVSHLKVGGKLVLNGDEPHMRPVRSNFRGICVTYGLEERNDFYASHDVIVYENARPVGMQFRVNGSGSSIPITIHGALGIPRMYAATAALAVAKSIGVDEVAAAQGLVLWEPPPGRVRLIKGLLGSVIIDDTYNSSPVAALAALDTLHKVEATRRIAVLGDMLELGKHTVEAHREVGKRASEVVDRLVTVGFRARAMAEAGRDAGMPDNTVLTYDVGESERAGRELKSMLQEGDVVLVKGSQAMRMERTVLEIMAEPERADELLVRQEEEWQSRP